LSPLLYPTDIRVVRIVGGRKRRSCGDPLACDFDLETTDLKPLMFGVGSVAAKPAQPAPRSNTWRPEIGFGKSSLIMRLNVVLRSDRSNDKRKQKLHQCEIFINFFTRLTASDAGFDSL
jgi:hypothetical protein